MNPVKFALGFTVSVAIVVALIGGVGALLGFRNPGFALFVNWMVMTWVALAGVRLRVSLPLPESYYRIRSAELDGHLYRRLGVGLFKAGLLRSPFAALNSSIRLASPRSSLSVLETRMRESEAGHLLIFLVMLVIIGVAMVVRWWDFAAWLMLFNIPINVYPVLLQRYNRARLARIRSRHSDSESP